MYRGGQILYSHTVHPLFDYRPSSDALYFILLALILSLLSYHITATLLDLLFGCKSPRKAHAHNLHTLLLTYSSSPLAIFRALFPRTFYRLISTNNPTFHQASNSQSHNSTLSIRHYPRVARLFLLISIAPVVNILVLLAELETSQTLSVSQAGLRGLALGVPTRIPAPNTLQLRLPSSFFKCNGSAPRDCRHYQPIPLRTSQADVPLINVTVAVEFRNNRNRSNHPPLGTAYVEVSEMLGLPTVAVFTNSRQIELSVWAVVLFRQLPGEEVLYFLPTKLSNQSASIAASRGQQFLASQCKEEASMSAEAEVVPDIPIRVPNARYAVTCSAWRGGEESTFSATATHMLKGLALLDTEKFVVDRLALFSAFDEFSDADASDFPLISRRKSLGGILLFTAVLALVLVVRVVVALVARNDLANGIGLILRDVGQVPWGDSMLGEVDVIVKYGEEFQVEPCLWEREDNPQKM